MTTRMFFSITQRADGKITLILTAKVGVVVDLGVALGVSLGVDGKIETKKDSCTVL
jgi:hypothetical protein